jgi:hypothetical protein
MLMEARAKYYAHVATRFSNLTAHLPPSLDGACRKIKEEDELDCFEDGPKSNQQMLRIGPQAIFQIYALSGDEGEFENLVKKIKTEVEVALGANEPQNSSRIAEVVPWISAASFPPPSLARASTYSSTAKRSTPTTASLLHWVSLGSCRGLHSSEPML